MQTINDVIKANEKEAYALSDSPHAEAVKNRVSIKEIETAESDFSELLCLIHDADLRDRIDRAAGRLSYAYEKLGFVEGYIADRALAFNI